MPTNSSLNGLHVPPDKNELKSSYLGFFIYPFSDKEIAIIPVLHNTTDVSFGFDFKDCKLSGWMYVQDIDDTVSSSAAKSFGTCK